MSLQRDYISYWYNARVAAGGDDSIRVAAADGREHASEVHFKSFPHRRYDGFGAVSRFLESHSSGFNSPPQTNRKAPSWWQIAAAFLSNGMLNREPIPWRYSNEAEQDIYSPIKVENFTLLQSQRIERLCKERRLSLSAVLMSSIHKVSCDYLIAADAVNRKQSFPWMFPIDMRGSIQRDDKYSNQSSALILPMPFLASEQQTQQLIRVGLKKHGHWKSWYLGNIGRLIGQSGVTWLHEKGKSNSFFMGSSTFLGDWHSDDPRVQDKVLYIAGLGNDQYPVTPTSIRFNGRLGLSLKVHASILPADLAEQNLIRNAMVKGWKQSILRCLDV